MQPTNRRYDIDWIRVIAIGLLVIYHVAIGFQSWGAMLLFITADESWAALWTPMTMLNVWRIPLLFFVSGMGVYFALQNRTMGQLLLERGKRILVPYVFGMFCIVPIHIYLWQRYHGISGSYTFDPGHLWFLGNIVVYVLVLAPLFYYMKRKSDGKVLTWLRQSMRTPLGLLPIVLAFVAEAVWINPKPYELYATTTHGFVLGMLAFFFGFYLVLGGETARQMMITWRWLFLVAAVGLFIYRINVAGINAPGYLLAIESNCWVFAVLAFGSKYLNRSGTALSYLTKAAYPVYILHMVYLYLGSMVIFPLDIAPPLQYLMLVAFTLVGCLATYEVIRRINVLRPLFGLQLKSQRQVRSEVVLERKAS